MFKKPKRIARKIGHDDDDEDVNGSSASADAPTSDKGPVTAVKRPASTARIHKSTPKPKQASGLRTSLVPEDAIDNSPKSRASDPFAAFESQRSVDRPRPAHIASSRLPYRATDEDTPKYSADYLAELKNATPTAPSTLSAAELEDEEDFPIDDDNDTTAIQTTQANSSLAHPSNFPTIPTIPTDAEIREKKERRRRLAAEQKAEDYISLNDNDDRPNRRDSSSEDEDEDNGDYGRSSLITRAEEIDPKQKYPESRVGVQALDDDDLAEGFDDFVEDKGRVALSRKGHKEQNAQRRKEIAQQIRRGEHRGAGGDDASSSEDNDNDNDNDDPEDREERARLAAYEASQTRHGTYALRTTTAAPSTNMRDRDARWREKMLSLAQRQPQRLPTLASVKAQLSEKVGETKAAQERCRSELERLRKEREAIAEEEIRVKGLVDEAGKELERIMRSNATQSDESTKLLSDSRQDQGIQPPEEDVNQSTAAEKNTDSGDDDHEDEDEDARPGLGGGGGGLGSGGGGGGFFSSNPLAASMQQFASGAGLGFAGGAHAADE